MAECNVRKKGMADSECPEVPVALKCMAKTPRDFVIPAATVALGQAAVLTYLQAQVLLGNVDLFPDFQSLEDISQEQVYQDTIFSITPVKDGNYRFRPAIAKSLCQHKAMFTHRTKSGRVFMIDDDGWWIGTKKTNGDFAGWDLDLLHTEKMKFNTGTEASFTPLMVAFKNNKEWDRYGMMVDLSQINSEIYKLIDVVLSIPAGSPAITASALTIEVMTECDGVPVEGLVAADFVALDEDGVVIAITAVTENPAIPGRYLIESAADFVDDMTINVDTPTALTIKPYQNASEDGVVITVP